MTTTDVTPTPTIADPRSTTPALGTRRLLTAGLVAGPLYVTTSLTQALTRDGFDLTRHAWSTLANGDLGWIQRANLAVTGTLVVLAALGLRSALKHGRGERWAPRLLGLFGAGMIVASAFAADPSLGFPAGTPADYREVTSTGIAHMLAACIAFVGAIACCFVIASRFATAGRRRWARSSRAVGVFFVASFVGLSGTGSQPGVIAFTLAVVALFTWVGALSWELRRTHATRTGSANPML